ncbi:MAG: glycosidase [Lentisphaeria bacterium]|nr:glycosidase [Lentisphaeria bacterium]
MILKLHRYGKNPILRPTANRWENLNVSNAAAAVHDGKVFLLYRAEGEDMRAPGIQCPVTRLGLAVSENGFDISERRELPVFDRDPGDPWCEFGCEDPRISKIGDTYYIVYVTMSRFGYTGDRLAWATTKDFRSFTRRGLLMKQLEQRTSGLLPGRIGGRYFLFHRPMPNLWGSFSPDLVHWEEMSCILETRDGSWYENKLGIGAPPIETPHGWLLFWHGKDNRGRYSLGVMLLDRDDPRRILKLQEEPILTPELDFERGGFVPNVVYTNGAVRFKDRYFVYYGCCDRCLAVGTLNTEEVDAWCRER